MISSGIVNAILGLVMIFIPGLLAELLETQTFTTQNELFYQLGGAAFLGFGLLNYSGRGLLLGGIYGKPILAGNWIFHLVAAFTLIRSLFDLGFQAKLIISALIYLIFAAGFLKLNYSSAIHEESS